MKLQGSFLSFFFLSILFLFSACGQPGDPKKLALNEGGNPPNYYDEQNGAEETSVCSTAGVSPAGIVGGQLLNKNNWLTKGVVFIAQEFQTSGQSHQSICTGSLIDSNLVITAAHCVDKSLDSYQQTLSVYFTHQPDCDRKNHVLQSKRRQVTAVKIHPNWDPTSVSFTNRGDLALIRISGKAPNGYQPLKLAGHFMSIPTNYDLLLAGYGMLNPDYYGDFGGPISLRVGKAPPISPTQKDLLLQLNSGMGGFTSEFDNTADNEMFFIDQSQGQGICAGDSGGPSLYKNEQGQNVVTGVASFVMNPENQRLLCGFVAAHTSVSFHRSWIESTFQELRNENSNFETPFQ